MRHPMRRHLKLWIVERRNRAQGVYVVRCMRSVRNRQEREYGSVCEGSMAESVPKVNRLDATRQSGNRATRQSGKLGY